MAFDLLELSTRDASALIDGWSLRRCDLQPIPGIRNLFTIKNGISVGRDPARRNRFRLSFAEWLEFDIDFDAQTVSLPEQESASAEAESHLLNDQIIPRILAHRGEFVLHAAGVGSRAGAMLFAGLSGSGKSTLAMSLHNDGFTLLGDDAIVVSENAGRSYAQSVYRSLRLFPDSIDTLVAQPIDLSPVASYTTKQSVKLGGSVEGSATLPIRAAFLLDAEPRHELSLQALSPADASVGFLEHSFWLDPSDIGSAKRRMEQASALASRVPAYRVGYPRDYDALPRLHAEIRKLFS